MDNMIKQLVILMALIILGTVVFDEPDYKSPKTKEEVHNLVMGIKH